MERLLKSSSMPKINFHLPFSRLLLEHEAYIDTLAQKGWKDTVIISHLIDLFVEGSPLDGDNYHSNVKAATEIFSKRIKENGRIGTAVANKMLVERARSEGSVCLPTEKAWRTRYSSGRSSPREILLRTALDRFCKLEYWKLLWVV